MGKQLFRKIITGPAFQEGRGIEALPVKRYAEFVPCVPKNLCHYFDFES
jgi:hypothetical protein